MRTRFGGENQIGHFRINNFWKMDVILLFSGVFKSVWREIKTCWNYLSCSICLCFEQWKNNIRNYWGVNDTVWTGYLFYTWLFMFSIRNFSEIQSSMSAALHTKPKKHSWLKPFISTSAVLYLIKSPPHALSPA